MKRFLGKVMAAVVACTMLCCNAFAYSDIIPSDYLSDALDKLGEYHLLDGYPDGTFRPDKDMTRAEMAAVIVRLLNMQDAINNVPADSGYSDVAEDHWAKGYIIIASQQRIIQGNGDGTFEPEEKITYEQAVKMLVCMLGYRVKFENNPDAYPTAYLAQANVDGLTNQAGGKIGEPASRGTVAKLAYNALSCPMMVLMSIGENGVQYGVADGKSLPELKTIEISYLNASGFFLTDSSNRVILKTADLKTVEAAQTEEGFDVKVTCNDAGKAKLTKATKALAALQDNMNVVNGVYGGMIITSLKIKEENTKGEITLQVKNDGQLMAKEIQEAIDNLSKD